MTKDIKKLTGAELKKQVKALDEQREFTIKIGEQEYKLSHDVNFRKTKQIKLIDDLVSYFSAGAEQPEILELATPYTALLIIKHFTTLEVSDKLEDALALLEVLIDLEVMDSILEELPEDKVSDLFEILSETVNNMTQGIDEQFEEKSE